MNACDEKKILVSVYFKVIKDFTIDSRCTKDFQLGDHFFFIFRFMDLLTSKFPQKEINVKKD